MVDTLIGVVSHIVFAQEDTGFTVARFQADRYPEEVYIKGILPGLHIGEGLVCLGHWKMHAHYGKQFEVDSFESRVPSDLVGIQKYLESGLIKGVGPVYAERIVKKFGLNSLTVIDEEPHRLYEVEGIGKKRVERILTQWKSQKSIRDVMVFLRGHQVSAAYAHKIYRRFQEKSIETVRQNPYSLIQAVSGIGFKTADKIAEGLGIHKESPFRIDAGIDFVLRELAAEGHTCYPEKDFLPAAEEILQVSKHLIEERIALLLKNELLFREDDVLWAKLYYTTEMAIAREWRRLTDAPCHLRPVDREKALQWVQEKLHITLAIEQADAVAEGLKQKFLIITGGPGTGKSTITKAILRIAEKLTSRILLAAPTGRAAKRMSEITRKKAFTIHALLELDFSTGKFKKNRENPLSCDLILVDEASMIDTHLITHLLKAIPDGCRVILIGDVDQLPSVGPGTVLRDFIQSGVVRTCSLKKIFRQAAHSKIITNAHRVNQGFIPDTTPAPQSDFLFSSKETPEEILQELLDLAQHKLLKEKGVTRERMQILSPMKKGIIGTENLNMVLQKALNPSNHPLTRMGQSFHLHDKVMQIKNNYQKEVYNGDIGKITAIHLEDQQITVTFDDRQVSYEFYELDELMLAYAVSIHKYQGSECDCIILPVHTVHFKLLSRNLLYTGITRGKKLVILLGTKKALAIAVNNAEAQTRHTGLKKRLLQY